MDFNLLNAKENEDSFQENFLILENEINNSFVSLNDTLELERIGKLFCTDADFWDLDRVYHTYIEENFDKLPAFILLDRTNNSVFRSLRVIYLHENLIESNVEIPTLSTNLIEINHALDNLNYDRLSSIIIGSNLNYLESRILIELLGSQDYEIPTKVFNYLAGNFIVSTSSDVEEFDFTILEKPFLANLMLNKAFTDESNNEDVRLIRKTILLSHRQLPFIKKTPNLSGLLYTIAQRCFHKDEIFIYDQEMKMLNKYEARILIEIIGVLIDTRNYALRDYYEIVSGQLN